MRLSRSVPEWLRRPASGIVRCVAIAMIWVGVCGAAQPVGAEIIDRVLAVVGGVVITQSDVTAASTLGLVAQEKGGADPVQAVLSKLVERQLILAEVDRYAPPEPTPAAVDQEVAIVLARFPSEADYSAALARTGTDDKLLRQILRDDLRVRAYLGQRFTVPPPTDEELERYYREHLTAFTRNGRPTTFADARPGVIQQLTNERRSAMIADWVGALRRRAVVTNLYLPRQ
jgi:hypothetical protein